MERGRGSERALIGIGRNGEEESERESERERCSERGRV